MEHGRESGGGGSSGSGGGGGVAHGLGGGREHTLVLHSPRRTRPTKGGTDHTTRVLPHGPSVLSLCDHS